MDDLRRAQATRKRESYVMSVERNFRNIGNAEGDGDHWVSVGVACDRLLERLFEHHGRQTEGTAMKKSKQPKKRYEPKPVPANSFVTLDSPLNTTTHLLGSVRVRRWHNYHGTPTMFQVVTDDGRVLRNYPYEPDALAECEAVKLVLLMEQLLADVNAEASTAP
jgi:hypothetical protein